jgi:chorismate mutase/prephenate dehydratase
MSQEKALKRPKRTAGTDSLATLRGQIDRIDRELVKLVNQRAEIALKIGKLKDRDGQAIYHPGREEDVLNRAIELSDGPLGPDAIRAIFREVISGSRALERRLRVAFLGPEHSYSHLAAVHRFGQNVDLIPVGTIAAVFEEVQRGDAQLGMVPLENSTDGRVTDTLGMFTRIPLRICGEVQLRIHHNLLGKCSRSEVQEVYSKPQAISQCRNWLGKHLPAARLVEVTSTSTAAQLASQKPGAAAIASQQAGEHYGLEVLARNIEDNPANLTRFAVIGDRCGDRSGNDKTALMFEVEHKPGGLADALGIFKRNRLNLTWIESFPIARLEGGYMFFVEMDGHELDTRVRRAIESLSRRAIQLEILGSYPKTSPIG